MALWGESISSSYTEYLSTGPTNAYPAFYALPDLPSNSRVHWLTAKEKLLALDRMKRAGKQLEEPFTWRGAKRILKKWHFWVYTTYYT